LSSQCQAYPVIEICGGGLYPHRYRHGEGLRNPSVYCMDLMRLITHVRERVISDLAGLIGLLWLLGLVCRSAGRLYLLELSHHAVRAIESLTRWPPTPPPGARRKSCHRARRASIRAGMTSCRSPMTA
jgi:hypothetical protein